MIWRPENTSNTSKKWTLCEFKTCTATHDKSKNPFDTQKKIPTVLQPRKSDGAQEPIR